MTKTEKLQVFDSVARSQFLSNAMIILIVLAIFYTTLVFSFPNFFDKNGLIDFDAFYIVGQMYWNGNIEKAYHFETMFEAQKIFSGHMSFMPWTYPPTYDILVIILPLVPVGISYLIFTSASFAFYLIVIKKLAGQYFTLAILGTFPALMVVVRCGQNGFLTGGLIGIFLLLFIRGSIWAGVPLGLMIIKPHLAIGIALLALVSARWKMIFVAVLVAVFAMLIATWLFGLNIWLAFSNGVWESTQFLKLGLYPLFRMTSVYAALRSVDMSAQIAMTVHFLCAILACAAIIISWFKDSDIIRVCGITAMASVFISPYFYDYDLTVMSLALALLASSLVKKEQQPWKILLIPLFWVLSGYGLIKSFSISNSSALATELSNEPALSLSGFLIFPLSIWVLKLIKKKDFQ